MYALHPEASAELEDAARWYEAQLDGLGEELLAALERTLELIVQRPSVGASWSDPRFEASTTVRRAVLARFPYVIVYSVEDRGVMVWSIAHTRRNAGFWATRVRS